MFIELSFTFLLYKLLAEMNWATAQICAKVAHWPLRYKQKLIRVRPMLSET